MEKINLDDILNKDGHTDVASAKRQMKKIQEDIVDIYTSLTSKKEEEDLPSWWNNKLAVSAAYLNSLRDYIVVEASDMLPPSVLQARRDQNNAS